MSKIIHNSIERFLLSPVFFILFSINPVFTLYVHNVHGLLLIDLFRPLAFSFLLAFVLFLCLQRVIRHSQTSALLVTAVYFSFFNYGDVRILVGSLGIIKNDKVLAVFWLIILILLVMFICQYGKRWDVNLISPAMNLMGAILFLFPMIRLLNFMITHAMPLEKNVDHTVQVDAYPTMPDIYYIILDGYTRSDVMMNDYGYDNSPFIDSLHGMGFYVAECSQSNYAMTSLSLSSSLNMDYLQNMSDVFQPEEDDLLYTFKLLEPNALRATLTGAGYETDAFASGFTWIEWRNADHFLSPNKEGITEFEVVVLFSSYARVLYDFSIVNLEDIHAEHYRERTRFVLDHFDELLKLPSPKFVFIHIIAPHDPFGFDENGNNVSPDKINTLTGYANQSRFIGAAIVPQIQKLIDGSANPPVIILQGDHGRLGSGPDHQMKILNAYYLPGHTPGELYPSISPVNTFRVVLNSYFGAKLPLLEDVSYYSPLTNKYDFTLISDDCVNKP